MNASSLLKAPPLYSDAHGLSASNVLRHPPLQPMPALYLLCYPPRPDLRRRLQMTRRNSPRSTCGRRTPWSM